MKSNKLRTQWHYPIYTLKTQRKVFIQIILNELRILESQNKSLKTTLGVYDFEAKKRPQSGIEKMANSQIKKIELGQKPSDFAKYPQIPCSIILRTNQKLSNLFVDESAFGSSAVRIEYIRELEFLVDALKKQNAELQTQIQTKKPNLQQSSVVVPKKYEGHDCLNDQILVQKSTLVNVSKIKTANELTQKNKLKPDNSLKDRQIQNLIEEKKLLEQEVGMYKETFKTRQTKKEGFDADKMIKKFDKNSIIYGAKLKYLTQDKHDEEIKEKYLQALLQETFLLQQQLQKIQEESKYYDPHKKTEY
ncbi:unnamed protein product (macronuclear) [Paramecium tetraurelia]|uniref:Uncharacterized protein n=1 Tax=Paramecium tetraurelia TaxID=5888 RepID=A0C840_PARTE|nr:uncharacterized protein GSPATT00036088001 [Paramecium tetraurelia]CAK66957.1 unnamed protein product [Paramecium tetraurelia]|eukprot:XP_001434354.1 hypothetical protein (macronuclear) [Paramecium tetraurelia strain d4-2]